MRDTVDTRLEHVERRLYRSVVDDGVWDLMLGGVLAVIGGSIAAGRPQLAAFVAPAAIAIGFAHTLLTARRAGYVRFQPARTRQLRRGALLVPAVALVLLAILLAVDRQLPGLVKAAILLAVPVAAAGYLFELPRFFAYAVIILLAAAAVLVTAAPGELALLVAGIAILVCGSVVLVRFLRRYPARIGDT